MPNDVLTYEVDATVGGKLAQIGSRLIDATAHKMAGEFFERLATRLEPRGDRGDRDEPNAVRASASTLDLGAASDRSRCCSSSMFSASFDDAPTNLGGLRRMIAVTMTVNQQAVTAEVEPRTLLIDFLRDRLRLTGAHVGCDTAQCGACVVHVDGKSVKSCTMLAVQANGREVLTIEGVHRRGALHPVQRAFHEHHALQCGFCTPGMVMSAIELLERNNDPEEDDIRSWLEGNLCRCTGYRNIISAVRAAARSDSGQPASLEERFAAAETEPPGAVAGGRSSEQKRVEVHAQLRIPPTDLGGRRRSRRFAPSRTASSWPAA